MFAGIRRLPLSNDTPGRNNKNAIADLEQFLEIRDGDNDGGAFGG